MDTIDLSKNDIHHMFLVHVFFFFSTTKNKNYSQWTCNHDTSNIINDNRIQHVSNDTIILCTSPLLTTRRNHFFIPIVKPLSRFLVPLINYTKLDDACLCSFSPEKKRNRIHTRSHQKYTFDMLTVYLFPRDLINPHFFFFLSCVFSFFFFSSPFYRSLSTLQNQTSRI